MGKTDPRVLKTRRKLKNAFLVLLRTKKISEVNVKDLTQTAEVTRGTFYLHFKDKEEFIETTMTELITDFFEAVMFEKENQDGIMQPRLSLTHVFEFVEEHQDFFSVLLKEKEALIYRDLYSEKLFEQTQRYNDLVGNDIDGRIPRSLFMNYMVYGVLGFIDQWVRDGKIYATHYMAENLYKMLDCQMLEDANLRGFFMVDINNGK
ncbi:TetR family transcriptional regulator [Vagococcus coleopterorum]|uniref:TetR family transcriptional regulator n=1 Tax=Vagococcus coleopterorum TaxID=2714946 RepID=A0A6G8AKT7_9ENTE|nr:TetR/AcrR family transcriptional regulator [Vagococcus coleopterorum]QIL45607.1 TetR family transcriptional regulator [Vagococcus coleopterorum]